MAEKKVTVRALKELRAENGKKVPIGGTTEVLESTSKILIANKSAELVVTAAVTQAKE
ncbi:MAG: hypothetical protein NTW78_06005 [Campylobacterales bacterium]|nr:hypothetical protein [Campylobacterales bacterium]